MKYLVYDNGFIIDVLGFDTKEDAEKFMMNNSDCKFSEILDKHPWKDDKDL